MYEYVCQPVHVYLYLIRTYTLTELMEWLYIHYAYAHHAIFQFRYKEHKHTYIYFMFSLVRPKFYDINCLNSLISLLANVHYLCGGGCAGISVKAKIYVVGT